MAVDLSGPEARAAIDARAEEIAQRLVSERLEKVTGQLAELAEASRISTAYVDDLKERLGRVELNNKSLKAEKNDAASEAKAALAKLQELGGEQVIAALLQLRASADHSPAMQHLASGNLGEFLSEITRPQREALELRINETEARASAAAAERDAARQQRDSARLESMVSHEASLARVRASALADVQLRARTSLSIREDAVVDAAGKPVDLRQWFMDRSHDSDHWWPANEGGGATGYRGAGSGAQPHTLTRAQASDVGTYERARADAARSGASVSIVD
jgi:hypothetical protein